MRGASKREQNQDMSSSSSQQPPDCALQLPSWDEFDQTEELDYDESDHESDEDHLSAPKIARPAVPPGFGADSSRRNESSEQLSSIPPDVRHNHNGSSSFFDQLPNSIADNGGSQPSSSHSIGPSLPPGFLLNGGNEDEEDPEDPGDPEDPDENDSRSRVPNIRASGSTFERVGPIGPAVPPGFGDVFSPSLPDEELRPQPRGTGCSSTMPPPEPEEARNSAWSVKGGQQNSTCSRTVIGPAFPDLLPTVSSTEASGVGDDDENEEEYGPAVPPELCPGPSTSREADLEMPVEGDEHCSHEEDNDDDVIGPMPPCEHSSEAVEEEYKERLAAYQARRSQIATAIKREEWMLQLPKKLTSFGMGARTFSKNAGGGVADEQSIRDWTESPADKAKRISKDGNDTEAGPSGVSSLTERDAVQEEKAAKLNKGRNTSLFEMHQRKRKIGDVETDDGGNVRRPFDRERDMEVRGLRGSLDLSEVKERCGQLSSRFGHSSKQKYL